MPTIGERATQRPGSVVPGQYLPLLPTPRSDAAVALVPGLAATALAVLVAFAINRLVPSLNASTVAVALGALAVNLGLVHARLQPGLRFVTKSLLRAAVVLLGLQLSLTDVRTLGAPGLAVVAVTVTVTFFGTQLIGRWLGVRRPLRLLVATGFSICGASAVAGMEPVADGDENDTVIAVALVTLCGSLAIVVLPLLQGPLHLDYAAFGAWTGASVHDVGQTVATANRVGHGALQAAIVVKLTRVVLLAPLVAGVALRRRRQASSTARQPSTSPGRPSHRPALVPLFVVGFVAAVVLRSTGVVPATGLRAAGDTQQVLLAAALFGLGTGVSWSLLRRAGGRPLVLGLASWLLVATVAYAGVRLTGR
ncbi:putative sulfate exporter family transporter [Jatrophihabitans telluris]|uniref:Sulfate exporter family transporter n=1 Tax=Jatrophihabitans telluris TaxID=2038343 RepID=A0ABY4R096_9ACTN|nr:putative sulfate exporter family transporter [Jatrophihabitans telluris]UQX88752.1 putative sulfate exporter family transporter [Jatrophihabitans telluris]